MNFFYILSGKKVKQVLIIVVASFFTAGVFYIEKENIAPAFSTASGPAAIYKVEDAKNSVSLTFNISWGDTKAQPIIDLLKKEGVKKATFFLSASWAERHPDIVKSIVDNGFDIGVMGYNYENYTKLKDNEIKKDIYKAQEVFKKMGVKTVNLLRTPDGNLDNRIIKVADSLGYTVIQWSINSNDWKNPGVEKITNTVLENVKVGDIILFHASDSAKQTAEALPTILKGIQKKGYSYQTVTEMIANASVKNEVVE